MDVHAINAGCVIEAAHDVPFSQLHEDLLGISESRGYCYSLNLPGARIWELIQTPTPLNRICDVLCAEFAVEPALCRSDVIEFILGLKAAGLAQVKDGSN